MSENKPLISFCLFSYFQKKFIKEAVEGALAQTYSPLEIIISDDCSTDGTFEMIRELAANYQGPHKIVLNRNPKNLGLGAHVDYIFSNFANGEWIVCAAGDDISLPERVETIYQAVSADPSIRGINSAYDCIDGDGKAASDYKAFPAMKLPQYDPRQKYWQMHCLVGCSTAWHRSVIKNYPPMGAGVVAEDIVLSFRARLEGSLVSLPDKLLKYRVLDSSLSYRWDANKDDDLHAAIRKREGQLGVYLASCRACLRDVEWRMERESNPSLKKAYRWHVRYYRELVAALERMSHWQTVSFGRRIGTILMLIKLRKKFALECIKNLAGYRLGFWLDGKTYTEK